MSYWYTCHMHECLIDTLLKTFSLQIMKSVNLSIFGKLQIYQYFTIWCLMKCCLPWKSATWMTLIFEKTLFPCSSRQMLKISIFEEFLIKKHTLLIFRTHMGLLLGPHPIIVKENYSLVQDSRSILWSTVVDPIVIQWIVHQ